MSRARAWSFDFRKSQCTAQRVARPVAIMNCMYAQVHKMLYTRDLSADGAQRVAHLRFQRVFTFVRWPSGKNGVDSERAWQQTRITVSNCQTDCFAFGAALL